MINNIQGNTHKVISRFLNRKVKVVTQSCPTLCHPMDCSLSVYTGDH